MFSTVGVSRYMWGYLEYHEVFSTMGDIMGTVRVILSTVGILSTMEGYQDACGDTMSTVGCSVPWGKFFCYLSTPWY